MCERGHAERRCSSPMHQSGLAVHAGRAARFGVVSMCIGSGMGAAAVFERGGEVDAVPVCAVPGKQVHLSKDAVV